MLFDPRWQLAAWQRLLLDAAELIEREGWCQRAFQDNGRCMLGALYAVNERAPDAAVLTEAEQRLTYYLERTIVGWNDERGRTKDEVIRRLREAGRGRSAIPPA